jgi:hypothetical protein
MQMFDRCFWIEKAVKSKAQSEGREYRPLAKFKGPIHRRMTKANGWFKCSHPGCQNRWSSDAITIGILLHIREDGRCAFRVNVYKQACKAHSWIFVRPHLNEQVIDTVFSKLDSFTRAPNPMPRGSERRVLKGHKPELCGACREKVCCAIKKVNDA